MYYEYIVYSKTSSLMILTETNYYQSCYYYKK